MAFAVEISNVSDKELEFVGYSLVEENEEFKVYRDKYSEDYVVRKAKPYLFVNELDEAQSLGADRVVTLGGLDD